MANIKFKRILVPLFVLIAMMFTTMGLTGLTAKAATAEEDLLLCYSNNRNVVKVIDEVEANEPKYFKALKDSARSQPEDLEDLLDVMNRIVAVANTYSAVVDLKDDVLSVGAAGLAIDADLANQLDSIWLEIETNYTSTYKLTEENYLTYDADGAILAQLESCLDVYKIKLEQVKVANELAKLLATNEANPGAKANQVYGLYDDDPTALEYGLIGLATAYYEGLDAILNATDRQAARDEAIKQLNAVPRNVFEYIYADYEEAVAVERGALSESEADLANNAIVQQMGSCQLSTEEFMQGASEDVKKAYSSQNGYLENYYATHQEYDGTADSKNTSSISYTVDGVKIVTITAYINNTTTMAREEARVFSPNATIVLHTATLSGEEKNVGKLLAEKNSKLGVGYLVRFNVYGGISQSHVFDTDRVNEATPGGVIYVIEFNVNKYYEQFIAKNQGVLANLLDQISLGGVWGAKNRLSNISDAYSMLSGTDVDLCYLYTDGALSTFENISYEPNGGNLMLETTKFGNFAIAATGTSSMLSNPAFWILLVVAIILVIILLVLVFKFVKYAVKFHSNGGTPSKQKVKARRGEYFTMPENPTRKGYVFTGWYEDENLTRRFLATRIIKRRALHAYAKWSLELTPDRVNRYYATLRNTLASHAILTGETEMAEDKTYAIIEKHEKDIALYLALNTQMLAKELFNVTACPDKPETPTLLTIATREDFIDAQKLVEKLVEFYGLGQSDFEPATKEETTYALVIGPAPVEEAQEEVVEEPVEEVVEEVQEEVQEEPVEEAVEEPVTEEQLIEYFTKIRNQVCGYALYEQNEKAEDGKMLVKLYKKDEAVYCYMALDAESYGLETVGLGFGDTPALLKVASDEDLEKALSLVEIVMTEHGLEKSDEPVEEKGYEGKGFGYRIHYVEE